MHNFIRFLNRNKNQIIRTIVIIIFVLIIIQTINYYVKVKNEGEISNNNILQNNTILSNEIDKGLVSNTSAITGENVPTEQLKNATTVIHDFITYCNEQDLESAYNLLTDECKQQMYTSLEMFKQSYYDYIFNGQKKTCTIENWYGDTYKVDINEDILSTGKYNDGYSRQDYITVKEVNNEYKLNINNYIGYTKIDKKTASDDITVEVISKNTYKDYEEYTMKVTNNTDGILKLDNINSTKTLYLEDSNGVKYSYYNHELTDATLTVASGQTKEVTIKFYSSYSSTREINYIVFSNINITNGQLSEKLEFRANV